MTDGACSGNLPPRTAHALSVLLFACAALPALASAQEGATSLAAPPAPPAPPAPSPIAVELGAGAAAPVDLHAAVRVTFFGRAYVGASLGAGVYGDAYTGIARATMGDTTAQVVAPLASSPFVATLSVGVRPFGDGFELAGGYTMMHAASSYDPATFASAVPEAALAASYGVSAVSLDVTLHAFHVELAYTFVIAEHFLLRPALGWTQTLAADATVATLPASTDAQVTAVVGAAGAAISAGIPRYAMTPTLGLELGYRF